MSRPTAPFSSPRLAVELAETLKLAMPIATLRRLFRPPSADCHGRQSGARQTCRLDPVPNPVFMG
jgi:hypothetical protein